MNGINFKRLITVSVVVLVLVVGLVIFLNRPGSLTINTEAGASISVATTKGGEFKKIGAGTATYKTSKIPSDLYIRITKDSKTTLSSARIDRRSSQTIELSLANPIRAQEITKGSVLNVFMEGTLVQGIDPNESMLVSFRTDKFETTRAAFVSLPYMKKVVWYDRDNFAYLSGESQVGQFKAGSDAGPDGIGTNLKTGPVLGEDSAAPSVSEELRDIAKSPGKPLVLMSKDHIYLSDDMGTNLREVISYKTSTEENVLFASSQSIFRVSSRQAGDEVENEKAADKKPSITIQQYDYSGKDIATYGLEDDSPVSNVIQRGERLYVLTANSLYALQGETQPQKQNLYFGKAKDIALYKDYVVLLGDDGLWNLGADGKSLQLLHSYGQNGVGLNGSMSVTADGRLVFGTTTRTGQKNDTSAMFSVSF